MKDYKPTTPGQRGMQVVDFKRVITAKEPLKSLVCGRTRAVGRNNQGRITTRHKGAGVRRLWREIDFRYDKKDIPAQVSSIEYDPNRTAFIALLHYRDGEKRYIIAPYNLRVGQEILTSETARPESGNRLPLKNIPVGTFVYNIELTKGRGASLVRSAGSSAMVLAQDGEWTHLRLPSHEIRLVRSENWASVGIISNPEHRYMTIGKAGRSRRKGIRPTVRGTVMNPVDHPHGGGEGRQPVGRRRGPATPWGKLARGVKTRKRKKWSNRFILQRRMK